MSDIPPIPRGDFKGVRSKSMNQQLSTTITAFYCYVIIRTDSVRRIYTHTQIYVYIYIYIYIYACMRILARNKVNSEIINITLKHKQ